MRTVLPVFARFLFAFVVLFCTHCGFLDQVADKRLFGPLGREPWADQGYVYFDDTGNITVVYNNTEFYQNPIYNATSFVAVWVFNRGADPYSRCCSGTGCSTVESNSCLVGFGWSNDLGFAGTSYLDLHPPEPFNTQVDRYYIPVYAAGKDALPASYQGEYTTFSSPTGIVKDRSQYDLYVGVFHTILHPDATPHRVTNQKKELSALELYTPIDPDWLSPVIPIEARFYEQSEGDSPGSFYILPSMLTWTPHGEIERFRDYRNKVMINEIVGNPNGTDGNTGAPEWLEIYNGSPYNVNLYGWRVSISNSSSVDLGITAGTTALANQSLPPGGYLVLAYYTTGQAAGDAGLVDTNLADGTGRVHVEFGTAAMTTGTGAARLYSDASNTIVDYVQYTTAACSTSQTGLSGAVSAGIWTSGTCVSGTDWLRRVPNGTDTNATSDWSGNTIPPGVPTPGAANN